MPEPPPDTLREEPVSGRAEKARRTGMRLKAALKANMARRKAQAQARTGPDAKEKDHE